MNYIFVFIAASFVVLGLSFSLVKLLLGWKQKEIYIVDPLYDTEIEKREKRISFLKLEIKVQDFKRIAAITYCLSVIFGYVGIIVILLAKTGTRFF